MRLTKPETPTVYVTFTDAKTRKSKTTTVYDTTPEKALEEYLRTFGAPVDPKSRTRRMGRQQAVA